MTPRELKSRRIDRALRKAWLEEKRIARMAALRKMIIDFDNLSIDYPKIKMALNVAKLIANEELTLLEGSR